MYVTVNIALIHAACDGKRVKSVPEKQQSGLRKTQSSMLRSWQGKELHKTMQNRYKIPIENGIMKPLGAFPDGFFVNKNLISHRKKEQRVL